MRSIACVTCAKRKVRCDREDPCSNCRKRQQECHYAEDQANERIKQLEALVLQLGGKLDQIKDTGDVSHHDSVKVASHVKASESPVNGSDASIVQEGAESLYLETPMWRAWNGKYFGPVDKFKPQSVPADLVATARESSIFRSVLAIPDTSFVNHHPSPANASYLWTKYFQRVQPTIKIFFEVEIFELRSRCMTGDVVFTSQQHALVFAVYLITILSLPEEHVLDTFGQQRKQLLANYQYACEQALLSYSFMTAYDIITLQTLTVYLYSMFSQQNFGGLWDVIGMLLRKAERMGLHRDGALLALSPFETERRRRVWWAIQSLDLAGNSMNGATSINYLADWEVNLPLNIEDQDINPDTRETPQERKGLTSMSYCLWRYWIIHEQRSFKSPDGLRYGMSWTVDKSLPLEIRRARIQKIEDDSNQRYLRFCDPIKSLDMTILIIGRAVVNFMRRTTLLPGPAFKDVKDFTKEDRQALLESSIKMIEYDRAVFTNPQIEPFRWHSKYLFPWSAFVHVLVELRHEKDYFEAEKLWKLVEMVYQSGDEFEHVDGDRRKLYAIGLTLDAWNHLQSVRQSVGLGVENKPAFLTTIEEKMSTMSIDGGQQAKKRRRDSELSESDFTEATRSVLDTPWNGDIELLPGLPLNFEDIDWLFWNLPGENESPSNQETMKVV